MCHECRRWFIDACALFGPPGRQRGEPAETVFYLVEVVIDGSSPPASDAEFASGTVSSQSGDTLTIESALGILEVRLADVILEELRPLTDPTRIDAGTAVNLGGGRSPVDRIISGVVLIPDASP